VRLALHLIDGVREGQPLGALLGYRLERTLHETGLDSFIDNLRAVAPLEAQTDSIDVVDGLGLLRKFHTEANFWNAPGLPAAGTPARAGVAAAIERLDDALDAVADLTLTESVHQLIGGNMLRAGATLDSIARGDTPPAEITAINTPRSGTALTYRLMGVAIGGDALGWPVTPRAQAEPRLNAWAASLLGDPSRVRIRARFVDARGASLFATETGLDQLGLAPLDLLSFPEGQTIAGELAARTRDAIAKTRPAAVPPGSPIEILTDRDPGWQPQMVALTEWLGLLRAVGRMIGAARAMEPRDLVAPGDAAGAIDTAELQSRADAAEAQLRAANAPALLAAFGVTVPDDLTARVRQLDQLAAGFTRASSTPDQLRDHDIARLQAIFGASFMVLPVLASTTAAAWPQLWANNLALQGGDGLASVRWFQRAARVRAGAARVDTAMMFAEALAGRPLFELQVAQLPFAAGDRWVALETSGGAPSSRLSLVAFSPAASTPGAAVAGIMLDEWIEVWPSAEQITGVSFQYTDPDARPPQAILLAVRPDSFPEWTMEAVEGSVLEALALAKIRAVDPDSLGALGHYLPALYFAYNSGGPKPDTISTDFNVVLKSSPASNP
jgi:hypothetical protein